MVVSVDQIREGGLEIVEPIGLELLAQALADEQDVGFTARQPAELKAKLVKVSGGVLLQGQLTAEVTAPCKRCLLDVNVAVPAAFTLNLVRQAAAPADAAGDEDEGGSEAGSFDLQNADQEPFNGKTIDLDPIVREQVLLALPMYVVCSEGCKGLCPMCGQNLNEKQCSCQPKPMDPRLAVLKDIKLN